MMVGVEHWYHFFADFHIHFFRFSEGSEEEGLGVVVVIEGGLCLTDSTALGTGYIPSEFLGELGNYGSDRVG